MLQLGYVLHIVGGTLGLVSGIVALIARKGGPLHRRAGIVFVAAMIVMAGFADYLAIAVPDQRVNFVIGTFTLYLVVTAWLAVRRPPGQTGAYDKIVLAVGLCLFAPFAILSLQIAAGWSPLFTSAIPYKGPLVGAVYGFTTVLGLAVIGDVRVVLGGGIRGRMRIARHLWRMCIGLTLALGSGFTNGLSRLLPGPRHVPTAFFLPQLVPLVLLVGWLVRLRFAAPGHQALPSGDVGRGRARDVSGRSWR
jgi:uncharacterized membrane protein